MSDRHVVATTMSIAGIMLGAFTVQLKDQISLRLGTLGFNQIMQCAKAKPPDVGGVSGALDFLA